MSLSHSKRGVDGFVGLVVLAYVVVVLATVLSGANRYLPWFVPSGLSGLLSIFLGVLIWDSLQTGGVRILSTYRFVPLLFIPFWLMTLAGLIWSFHPEAYWGDGGRFIFLPLYDLLALLMGVMLAAIPSLVRHYRQIFIVSFSGLIATILFDIFFTGGFSTLTSRAAGFAENPNASAILLIALAICSIDWRRPDFLNSIVWFAAGIGVFATLSRSGLALYILALGAYVLFTAASRFKAFLGFSFFTALTVATLFLSWSYIASLFGSIEMFSIYSTQQRIENLNAIARGEFGSLSADTRVWLLGQYMNLISEAPVLGYGTGFSYSQQIGPHNIYQNQWVNNGIVGLILLLAFLLLSFWHFLIHRDMRGLAFVGAFSIGGFSSHNLLDTLPLLVIFGFLGTLAHIEDPRTVASVSPLARKRRNGRA